MVSGAISVNQYNQLVCRVEWMEKAVAAYCYNSLCGVNVDCCDQRRIVKGNNSYGASIELGGRLLIPDGSANRMEWNESLLRGLPQCQIN
jgi:hypothetical protein